MENVIAGIGVSRVYKADDDMPFPVVFVSKKREIYVRNDGGGSAWHVCRLPSTMRISKYHVMSAVRDRFADSAVDAYARSVANASK